MIQLTVLNYEMPVVKSAGIEVDKLLASTVDSVKSCTVDQGVFSLTTDVFCIGFWISHTKIVEALIPVDCKTLHGIYGILVDFTIG